MKRVAARRRLAQGAGWAMAGSRRAGSLKALAELRRLAQAGWLKARVAKLACLTPVSRVLTSPISNTPAASPLGVTHTAQQPRLAGLQPTDSLQVRGPEAAKTVAPCGPGATGAPCLAALKRACVCAASLTRCALNKFIFIFVVRALYLNATSYLQ